MEILTGVIPVVIIAFHQSVGHILTLHESGSQQPAHVHVCVYNLLLDDTEL